MYDDLHTYNGRKRSTSRLQYSLLLYAMILILRYRSLPTPRCYSIYLMIYFHKITLFIIFQFVKYIYQYINIPLTVKISQRNIKLTEEIRQICHSKSRKENHYSEATFDCYDIICQR
jgi:hypothetical protein